MFFSDSRYKKHLGYAAWYEREGNKEDIAFGAGNDK
jgi:hypothetical protein